MSSRSKQNFVFSLSVGDRRDAFSSMLHQLKIQDPRFGAGPVRDKLPQPTFVFVEEDLDLVDPVSEQRKCQRLGRLRVFGRQIVDALNRLLRTDRFDDGKCHPRPTKSKLLLEFCCRGYHS